jgi:peptidyl-prolyl cis-trans isomerase C
MRWRAAKRAGVPGALAVLAACATLAALASGCGQSAIADVKAARAQPLATVNGVEISLLPTAAAPSARAPGAPLAPEDKVQLESLIDNQLLQEQAVRDKLDRSPLVQQAIARATADVLAEASLQSTFSRLPPPTRAQVDAYFEGHPELFAGRKLFFIKQLVIDARAYTPALKAQVERAASIEQVARWLDAHAVRYERSHLSRSSAELSPEMLVQLKTMRERQLFVVAAGPQLMVDMLADVTPVPLTAAQAAPQIDAYLRTVARKRAADAEVARLRERAKISYVNPQRSVAATTNKNNHHPMESQ